MNPREFHDLALKLIRGGSPAEVRSAISRAYYAAFHVGAEILEGMGFTINKGPGAHGEVRNRLGNSGDPDVVRVSSLLGTLHSRRIEADYRLNSEIVENPKNAQGLVNQANDVIQTLIRCCEGPHRARIIQAIRDWEVKTHARPS
jgi:uncharacterized protein (UPF0332 family)